MGINVGAALGTILVGYLGETIGWAYGFGLAGIGMLIGLIVFVLGKPALRGRGEAPAPLAKSRRNACSTASALPAVAVIWALIQYQDVIQTLLIVSGVALLGYVAVRGFKLPKEPRERMFAMLFLIALNPLFWGLFEQAGGSLNLYTDRFVDRGGRADQPVPVDQPDLHHPARADLRRPVAMARQAAGWSRRHRPSSVSRWRRWASASWSSCGARTASARRR